MAAAVFHYNNESVNCGTMYRVGDLHHSFAGHRETRYNDRRLSDIIWSLSRWSTSDQAVIPISRKGRQRELAYLVSITDTSSEHSTMLSHYMPHLPELSSPSTADCRPTKMPTTGGHVISLFHMCSPTPHSMCMALTSCVRHCYGTWLRSAKMLLSQSQECISTTDYIDRITLLYSQFEFLNFV